MLYNYSFFSSCSGKQRGVDNDFYNMGMALDEAKKASFEGEVPVGSVIVYEDNIISSGHNITERALDPTSHAEICVIRGASKFLQNWRLTGTTLFVTLEPCTMCIGAAILARIDRLVFGCFDPKGGAVGSLYNISDERALNHKIEVTSGVRAKECSDLLKTFFKELRISKN